MTYHAIEMAPEAFRLDSILETEDEDGPVGPGGIELRYSQW